MAPSRATDGPLTLDWMPLDAGDGEGPDRPLLVLLHGAEDDPAGMRAWIRFLDPGDRFRSFAVAAPFGDATARTWFATTPRGPVGADVRMSLDRLAATIVALSRLPGVSAEDCALVGYSQGGAMALLLVSDRPSLPVGAAASVCGWLPDLADWPEPVDPVPRAVSPARVLVINTLDDEVVPVDFGEAAALALRAQGVPVDFVTVEGTHHPGPELLTSIGEWLSRSTGDEGRSS